jgi:hypothetical protein
MGDFEAMASDDAAVWRGLYDQLWRIFLQEEAKAGQRGADVRAARRAADLVEQIRVTERAVVAELLASGIEQDVSREQLRERA